MSGDSYDFWLHMGWQDIEQSPYTHVFETEYPVEADEDLRPHMELAKRRCLQPLVLRLWHRKSSKTLTPMLWLRATSFATRALFCWGSEFRVVPHYKFRGPDTKRGLSS